MWELPTIQDLRAIPCLFMRGGTSRGAFFRDGDLPAEPGERDAILLAAYGSPDLHQIDGIGGANAVTSKAAIVARSERDGIDVDYTFCQVGIDQASVSRGGNCGNMLAAVGPFALLAGIVTPRTCETPVRIYTTNTDQVVTAHVPMRGQAPAAQGDLTIQGVPGSGAPIHLAFEDCAGSMSNVLLPTGKERDLLTIDGKDIPISLVDAATPFVFVAAANVGADGRELPAELLANEAVMHRLEKIRGWAATVLGIVEEAGSAREVSPNIPRVMVVSCPRGYRASSGLDVAASEIDICVRQLAMQRPHRAISVTGSICCAAAAALPGTVVHECLKDHRSAPGPRQMRLGHPSGTTSVSAHIQDGTAERPMVTAAIDRTARLLMSGHVYVSPDRVRQLAELGR